MQDFVEYKVCTAIGAQKNLVSLFAATKTQLRYAGFFVGQSIAEINNADTVEEQIAADNNVTFSVGRLGSTIHCRNKIRLQ